MKIKLVEFYQWGKQIYDSKIFQTIRSFGERIYNDKIEIHETNQEQANLLEYSLNFNSKTKPRSDEDKNKKSVFDSAKNLYESKKLVLNAFNSGLFPLKSAKGTGLKILTPK